MDGLILHVGGERTTYAGLAGPEIPAPTDSYQPVGHQHLVDRAKCLFVERLGYEVAAEGYGLARDGAQMFGVLRFEAPDKRKPWGPVVGLRNSYDKTLSVGIATGACVFVCDNLAFSGSALTLMRKHTSNVLEDLDGLLGDAAAKAGTQYQALDEELRSFKGVPLSLDQGFAELGVLFGRKTIQATQFTAAVRAWENPEHSAHSRKDLYCWYQAVTSVLRRAAPGRALAQHTALHDHALALRRELRRRGSSSRGTAARR